MSSIFFGKFIYLYVCISKSKDAAECFQAQHGLIISLIIHFHDLNKFLTENIKDFLFKIYSRKDSRKLIQNQLKVDLRDFVKSKYFFLLVTLE
jgi:hypothetical protein